MTEPETWPTLEMSALERKLLDAARGDRVPNDLGLRIASALANTSVAPAVSSLAPGALLFSKTSLWGFLSIALLAGAGALYAGWPAPHADAAARAAALETPNIERAASAAPPAPEIAAASAPAAAAATPDSTAAARADRRAATAAVQGATRAASPALQEEIELLDRARDALQGSAPQRALRLLEQHRARFAHGTLVPEAEALRIESLARIGETKRARRAAQRFLIAYPTHPMSERVRGLAE